MPAADPALKNLILDLFLVFGGAKLLSEVAERLGQPGVVGEILAGVLLGPAVLGWVQPGQMLAGLSEIGVIFLLFRVGLEVKPTVLMRSAGPGALTAVLGLLAPFALGYLTMRGLGEPVAESLFVGAALVATSVGITAQVLSARGLLAHRASQMILAAAVIDDVLGLLILAVVTSLVHGSVNATQLVLSAALAIGFVALSAHWGSRAAVQLVPRVERKLLSGDGQFHIALVVLFGLAVLAGFAGVAAIVGAFLAGLALSETVSDHVHTLVHGVAELMVPFFLAGIGLSFDLSGLGEPATLRMVGLITLIAVVTKIAGCGLGALSLGWRDALRVGVGMVPRGEVSMVVAQLGLSMGVVPKHVYTVLVTMAVATTIVAPPLIGVVFRGEGRSAAQPLE